MKKFGLVKGSNAVKATELMNEKEVDTMELMSNAQQNAEATPQAPVTETAAPEKIGVWQRVKNTSATVGKKAGKVVSTTCKVVGGAAIIGGAIYGISKLRSHHGQDETDNVIPEYDEDSSYSEISSEDEIKES